MKSLMLVFALLVTVASASAQKGSPELVDEIGKTTCEDLLARTDNFANQLQTHPGSDGTVIVFGPMEMSNQYPLTFMHRAVIGRWGLKLPIRFFAVDAPEPWRVQFWRDPQTLPKTASPAELRLTIPFTITSRFLFGRVTGDPCSNHIENGFLDVLRSDPKYTARIVEYNSPRKERSATVRYWRDFIREHRLAKGRVRVYFKKDATRKGWAETALWILPDAKKVY